MRNYRRGLLQLGLEPLGERAHAYLLGRRNSGALDQRRDRADDPGQQAGSGRVAGTEVRLYPGHPQRAQPRLADDGPQPRTKRRLERTLQ